MSFWNLLSSAKDGLSYITGKIYGGEDPGAAHLRSVQTDCDTAKRAAQAVAPLFAARVLDPAKGTTPLRAAKADATRHVETGRKALESADKTIDQMVRALGNDHPAIGRAREKVATAQQSVESAGKLASALATSLRPALRWHDEHGRLATGFGTRIDVLEQTRPGTTGPMRTLLEQAQSALSAAPGHGGTKWNDDKILLAVQTAKSLADQLEKTLADAESQLDPEAADQHMSRLRSQALQEFSGASTGGFADLFDRALGTLQQVNPDIRMSHLSALSDPINLGFVKVRGDILAAKTPADMQLVIERGLQSMRDRIGNIADRLGDPAEQQRLKTSAETRLQAEQDRADYETRRDDAAKAIERLRIAEAKDHGPLRAEFTRVCDTAEKTDGFAKGATDLADLLARAEQALEDHEKEVERALDPLKERLEAVSDAYEDLETDKVFSRDAGVKAVLAAIARDIEEAGDFLDCQGNVDAAEPAGAIIAHAEQLLADFKDLSATLTQRDGELAALLKRLGKVNQKLVPAPEIQVVQNRIAAARAAIATLTSQELQAETLAIGQAIDGLEDFVTLALDWRKWSKTEVDRLEKGYDDYAHALDIETIQTGPLDAGKGALHGQLTALKALRDAPLLPATFDQHMQTWERARSDTERALAAVWDGTQLTDLQAAQTDIAAGLLREQAIKDARTKAGEVREALAAAAKVLPATGPSRIELELLQGQLDGVLDNIDAAPNEAMLILLDIEARSGRLKGTPAFNAAVSRAIAQVPAQWQEALKHTAERLTALEQAIATNAGGTPYAAKLGEVRTTLGQALDGFDRAAFTGCAAILADAQQAVDKRRAAREEALRLVRQYRERLLNDPLARHLQANPFKVPVFGPLFRLLEAVELEAMRVQC